MEPVLQTTCRLDLQVVDSEKLDNENWDFEGSNTGYLMHKIHSYPARFIPQIPRRAITRWSAVGNTILDPFCGCGTTLLEAALLGRNSVGVDNNPVATLISRAKTRKYQAKDIRVLTRFVSGIEAKFSSMRPGPPNSLLLNAPRYDSLYRWFDQKAVLELEWLRSNIQTLPYGPKLMAMSAFSFIVLSTSRQSSDTRYTITDRKYVKGLATKRWVSKMKSAIERASDTSRMMRKSSHKVILGDSRTMPSISDRSIDLIVTSPPYLNTYDYHKYHRHRMHWIGGDIQFARNTEIGKHDVFTRPGATPDRYFDDMRHCITEWERMLCADGRALVVVGDAIVNGTFVPVGDSLVKISRDVGLALEKRWVRRLAVGRKSFNQGARIKREHILLFRKQSVLH